MARDYTLKGVYPPKKLNKKSNYYISIIFSREIGPFIFLSFFSSLCFLVLYPLLFNLIQPRARFTILRARHLQVSPFGKFANFIEFINQRFIMSNMTEIECSQRQTIPNQFVKVNNNLLSIILISVCSMKNSPQSVFTVVS